MAYLHCHNCDWEQDDFWDWRYYNPLISLRDYIKEYIKPRRIEMDRRWVDERELNNPVFSWTLLWFNIGTIFRNIIDMKYWTEKSFIKAKRADKANCPGCGSHTHWDID